MTSAFPSVSVIMPVRNGERFIAEALASVLAQEIEPQEILIIDGHSTDRSREIAGQYSGVQILTQPGRGVPDAYNFGVALARGEFVALLECDDQWTPDKLRIQLGYMLHRPELQFTLAHVEMFLERGCALPPGYRSEWLERPQTGSVLSTFVARKSVFDLVGKFDSGFSRAGDVDWFARAKDFGARMEILPETLLRKRIHDCNLTSAVAVNNLEMLAAVKLSIARQRGVTARQDLMVEADVTAVGVSVIVPVFNGANYLREAVSSVLAQSVPPGEIIVVDDGSTDDTPEVAQDFSSKITFCQRPHSGIGTTRNHGISMACGKWLAFLDADDVWLPDKLAKQLAFAKQNLEAQIIFGGIEQFISPELDGEERRQLALTLEKTNAPHCGTMLARCEVFDRIGRFDTSLRVGEFIDWFARARDAGMKIMTIPDTVMRRRWHRSNLSRSNRNAFGDLAGILKKAMDRRRQPGLEL